MAEGKSEAVLIAQTAVEPLLDGRPVSAGLSPAEVAGLRRLVSHAVRSRDVLRLRVRDLSGQVAFSDDGSGFKEAPEDEALDAAEGTIVGRLTQLNSDSDDTGPVGPESVEVYLPLNAGNPSHRVGVLEIYLPYAPINADVSAGLHNLYRDLVIGLGALYVAIFVISVSVTRRLRRQVKVNQFLAEHDPLTELPNRTLFHRRVTEALEQAERTGRPTVVAIADLDRFKEINDTLGHKNGDQLLKELARRLASSASAGDAVARLGGDEFAVVLGDVDDPRTALFEIRRLIEREAEVNGLTLTVESSIGFAVAPDDGSAADELLQHAEIAMYVAKSEHLGVTRYDKSHDHYDASNLELITQLRRALQDDELVLHYQPKATLPDGKIDAVEALVRWHHPTRGLLAPDRFIPLAEQTDLIDELTAWVLRHALEDLRGFGPDAREVSVAVNVSARNLVRSEFASQVMQILEDANVSPQRLIVEITETALLTDPPRAAKVLRELDAAQVRVSLDDFGIGHTSLSYLSALPVRELKIDKSFVSDMLTNAAHAAIVNSIVDLGHNLSLRVVAEGVETPEVLSALTASGCDLAQGFLLARPMPAAQLRDWLAGASTRSTATV